MCLLPFTPSIAHTDPASLRFMQVPRGEMEKDLKGQEKAFTEDINALNKKVCDYCPSG